MVDADMLALADASARARGETGYETNSPYTPSMTEQAAAIAELAAQRVPGDGLEVDTDAAVAQEICRIAVDAPWERFTARSGEIRTRPLVDPARASAGLNPRPPERPGVPGELPMTDWQAGEVIRLTGQDTRRAAYGVLDSDCGADLELTQRKVDSYTTVELAADGSTRTYTSNDGSVTVTEFDATEDGGTVHDAEEIARYLDMQAEAMGQSPLQNMSGNRTYGLPPESSFGQRTAGPWSSVYGQG